MKVLARLAALTVVILTFQGCAVQKQLVATGGSRADGTVKMSYEFGIFEQPVINVQQGLQSAIQRCQSWGYTGAEAFGGQTKQCNAYGSGTCNSWLVTMEFQCIGGGKVASH
jgi:hypothetical protein